MTATDQDEAAERAAQYLAKLIRGHVPESLWADPLKFARDYWDDARKQGHWRYMPPAPGVVEQSRGADAVPANEEFKARKAAITRKDDHA